MTLTLELYLNYYKSSAVADMGDRARATWAERGGCCAPFHGQLGSHLTQCRLGRGLPQY